MEQHCMTAWTNHFSSFLEGSTQSIVGVFSTQRDVLFSNLGLQAIVGADIHKAIDFLVNPTFDKLLEIQPGDDGMIFSGIATISNRIDITVSLICRIYRHEDQVLFFGEHDVEEINNLNKTVLDLNKEVNHLQREVMQKNRTLEKILGDLCNTQAMLVESKKIAEDAMQIISGSIQYASRIQSSILPLEANLEQIIPDRFIVWEPRDVVGGDMYWCRPWGDGHLVALGDCTGHGVPGAFMTMISNGALGHACMDIPHGKPGLLLQRVHQLIQSALGQNFKEGASDDGLELGICYISNQRNTMIFSGARFDLFVLDDEDVSIIKGTKKGTGYRGIPENQTYQDVSVELQPGKRFYMTSDGIIDQVGGDKKRGFGKRKFRELLFESRNVSLDAQSELLLKALKDHQGQESRRDDVSIIGFSLNTMD